MTYIVALMMIIYAQQAEAFCPACVFAAGTGLVNAVTEMNIYPIGVWAGVLIYVLAVYIIKEKMKKLGFCSLAISSMIMSVLTWWLIMGIISVICAFGIDLSKTSIWEFICYVKDDGLRVFIEYMYGVTAGIVAVYITVVIHCLICTYTKFHFPFMRLTMVTISAWLVSIMQEEIIWLM